MSLLHESKRWVDFLSFKCYNYQKYSVSSLITETDYKEEEEKLTSDREDVDRFLWYLRLIAPRMAWRQSPPLLWFVGRKHLLVCWEKLSGDRKKEGTKWRLESSSKQLGNKCTLSQAKRGWGREDGRIEEGSIPLPPLPLPKQQKKKIQHWQNSLPRKVE